MVLVSDLHYGLTRKQFRGQSEVPSTIVNKGMIQQINQLPRLTIPNDQGVSAGNTIGAIDCLIATGDIANRQESPSPAAAISWKQFTDDYEHLLAIKNKKGNATPLLLVPGNHDVSNAIGFYREMQPATDASSYLGIYNKEMHPATPKTTATFNYATDKVNYSVNQSGIHLLFITIWPDSATRIWMEKDLKVVKSSTPVIIFTHDPPDGDPKHFTNPNGSHDLNATDKFENLLAEIYKDGFTTTSSTTEKEQKGWVTFLQAHPNIKAYFHGHNNWNEFYTYRGPEKNIALPAFRVDSPMKGKPSSTDETKLSFQLISIDPIALKLTVRECLWNAHPEDAQQSIVWGSSVTIGLE